jgi:hypothetical protein
MKAKPNKTLVRAFLALTDEQLENLQWHVENLTPICCGRTAEYFTGGRGGG